MFLNLTSEELVENHNSFNIFAFVNWGSSLENVNSSQLNSKENFDSKMKDRQERIHETCEDNDLRQSTHRKEFYHLKDQRFLWCPVFKAASTTWIRNLFQLADVGEGKLEMLEKKFPKQPDQQARIIAPEPSSGELSKIMMDKNYTRLLVVRHPFQRLVSAYRDKLERCHSVSEGECDLGKDYFYNNYGKHIVSRFRRKYLDKFGEESLNDSSNSGAPYPALRTSEMPTWWEFVQWVISFPDPENLDPHWRPAYVLCTPCTARYNYILKFENIQEEQGQLANLIPMGSRIKPKWENRNDGGLNKTELTETYFEILSDEDVDALFDIYETDFQMFGYSFQIRGNNYNS